jgi:Mrp family chromosome partitioning ATPase
MSNSKNTGQAGAVALLESLPGIGDVVWSTIMRLAGTRVPTSVLLTAAERGAGTSVLAAATAIGLAQHQRVPVCLVETNLRRPALARYLGLRSAGLSEVLDGSAGLEQCLQEVEQCPGLCVLPAGGARAPVSGEFTTERMSSVLARLEQRCHFLVLDTAPLLDHVESRLLLNHADGVLLVLRSQSTRLADAERAYEILVQSGAPVLGSIFNAYTGSARFSGNVRVHQPFEKDAREPRTSASQPASISRNGGTPHRNGNGIHDVEAHAPEEPASEAAHQQQILNLERRIAKLTRLLEQTEAALQRGVALESVDPGIASLYHGPQGVSPEDQAQACKRALMQDIFQANLELQSARSRRP